MKYRILPNVFAAALLLGLTGGVASAACAPTGFWVDGNNMTAAMINPGEVTGEVDATGCNIGVYYDTTGAGGTVDGADIHSASYFGVVVNGGGGSTGGLIVNVENSTIENIGDTPFDGAQHGNAIFYINASTSASVDDSRTCGNNNNSTTGTISGNMVRAYQKNGITVKCPGVSVLITGNTVTGAGPVNYIAQNGIEVAIGASATVSGNTVSGNAYTGTNYADSSGILVIGDGPFGAPAAKEQVTNNVLTDNDVGIFSVNCGNADCTIAPRTNTDNLISGNTLSNSDISNISGCGGAQGYQAAISDLGRNDKIKQNNISGVGYTPNNVACTGTGTTPAIFDIDRSAQQGPRP